ncbi:nucleotide exchange factor GrpE [Candidatus Beckwithbacteria bacterium CG23_combo_of_CG06-09_8_20_14_all_47_9]|uniref:Protein GrpE n=1 Tax=Candidatus Beckwithbacteria bacterium CG23_combo_of_CG06-09_8_20_14_all_47_9 TaxID=1974498 RepID=A0A2H0B3W2_9BACT|nr:MAG: nucleotide exchange factor GrpE [Candidatus Beckwithbacteria bacterium CG23_combo_of_CG06-09_8_20_14_all_47_9]
MVKKNRQPQDDQLKRALADYQNLTKRVEAERLEFVKYVLEQFLAKLLPVVDALEAASTHLKDQGLGLALQQLKTVLAEEGVKKMSLINQPFDPKTAECVEIIPGKKDQVVSVTQKGYLLNDKVLRPARVKVGKG